MACPVDHTMLDPAIQDDPWDLYQDLHDRCPVFPMPEIGAVMVTRYEDVRFVLTNPELFSSAGRERRHQERPAGRQRSPVRTDPARARLGPRRDAAANRPTGPHRVPSARRQGLPPATYQGDGRPHRRRHDGVDRWADRQRHVRVQPRLRDAAARDHHRRGTRPRPLGDPPVQPLGRGDVGARHATADGARTVGDGGDRARGTASPRGRVRAAPPRTERRPDLDARTRPRGRGRRRAAHRRRTAEPHAPTRDRRVRDHDERR